jgi:hypothetical protein
MGGTARVSVRVDAAWRVHVLVGELVSRGLVVSWLPLEEPQPEPPELLAEPDDTADDVDDDIDDDIDKEKEIDPDYFDEDQSQDQDQADVRRTDSDEPFRVDQHTPATTGFEVRTAYSSRLNGLATAWPAAAARLFLSGPRLRLWVAAAGEPRPGGFALGLDPEKDAETVDAALVRAGLAGVVSDAGLHYVISGRKRLARLAELVGERPAAAPEALWPGVAAA